MQQIPYLQNPAAGTILRINNEPMILLTEKDGFDVHMQYPMIGMKNAEHNCYVRKEVLRKLKIARDLLPDGYKLRIWDAWRPFALQIELYEKYKNDIINNFNLTSKSEAEKKAIISKFVSLPNNDIYQPPVHTTGGSVDVTIVDSNGNELEMGTDFDAFSAKTQTNYFECTNESLTIRNNRRLLFHCMTQAGFTNLPSEWWHYDYGNRFWAYYNNCPAIYEGIFTVDDINIILKETPCIC